MYKKLAFPLLSFSFIFTGNLLDLHVKSGPREIKSVQTHASGRVREIYTTWAPDLKTQTTLMKDVKSGKFVKFTMENFVDFSGTFKVASITGLEQYCGVLGLMDSFYIMFGPKHLIN